MLVLYKAFYFKCDLKASPGSEQKGRISGPAAGLLIQNRHFNQIPRYFIGTLRVRGISRKSTFKRMMILRPHLLYSEARSREVGVGHKENKRSEVLGCAPVTVLIREP